MTDQNYYRHRPVPEPEYHTQAPGLISHAECLNYFPEPEPFPGTGADSVWSQSGFAVGPLLLPTAQMFPPADAEVRRERSLATGIYCLH